MAASVPSRMRSSEVGLRAMADNLDGRCMPRTLCTACSVPLFTGLLTDKQHRINEGCSFRTVLCNLRVNQRRREVSNVTGVLQDKVAIVTGAAQGIGEAYARGLAEQGAAVTIADVNA